MLALQCVHTHTVLTDFTNDGVKLCRVAINIKHEYLRSRAYTYMFVTFIIIIIIVVMVAQL